MGYILIAVNHWIIIYHLVLPVLIGYLYLVGITLVDSETVYAFLVGFFLHVSFCYSFDLHD